MRHYASVSFYLYLILCQVFTGCGDADSGPVSIRVSESDEIPDENTQTDVDSESGGDTEPFVCPAQLNDCESHRLRTFYSLLNADEIDLSAEFVQVTPFFSPHGNPHYIPYPNYMFELLLGGNKTVDGRRIPFLVWYGTGGSGQTEYHELEIEAYDVDMQLVAAYGAHEIPNYKMEASVSPLAAICSENACFVASDDTGTEGVFLEKIEGSDFPIDFKIQDLFIGTNGIHIVGNGEYVFDSHSQAWHELIAPTENRILKGKYWVASSLGEVLISDTDDEKRIPLITEDNAAFNDAWKDVAVGDDGLFVYLESGMPNVVHRCHLSAGDDFTLISHGGRAEGYLFNQSGDSFMFNTYHFSFCRAQTYPTPVIDSTHLLCGDGGENHFLLTSEALYASELFCPIE